MHACLWEWFEDRKDIVYIQCMQVSWEWFEDRKDSVYTMHVSWEWFEDNRKDIAIQCISRGDRKEYSIYIYMHACMSRVCSNAWCMHHRPISHACMHEPTDFHLFVLLIVVVYMYILVRAFKLVVIRAHTPLVLLFHAG